MAYVILEWLHILSSATLFGTALCSAFYLFFTNRARSVPAIATTTRNAVIADWLFTTPTAIVQPVSGFAMARLAGVPWTASWIAWSTALYALAIVCWLPAAWVQARMARIADDAWMQDSTLPPLFWRYHRVRVALGVTICAAFIVIFYLMVAKPK